jgi:indoleamine 2,3-dioxygenase
MQVSEELGIAPVLTFADTVLWNWQAIDPARPMSIDNMRFGILYSGTQDEANFYISSAEAELFGVNLIGIIHRYTSMSDAEADEHAEEIQAGLEDMRSVIEKISTAIQSVRNSVDPKVFYEVIRPWWVGSTTERPWIFEGVAPRKDYDVDGPSAGQSAIMHTLDVFLDIDHRHARSREIGTPISGGFMDRMRRYMPRTQREFLERLALDPRPIREYARASPLLREPYNKVVKELARLRDLHIRVATLYIVTQSKSGARCPFAFRTAPSKGTGGNHVAQLLKASRDATKAAVLESL